MPCAMGFDKAIHYISHRKAFAMGFDKGIDYISHHNALRDGFL